MALICSGKSIISDLGRTSLGVPTTIEALEEVFNLIGTDGIDIEAESVVDGKLSVYAYDYRRGKPDTTLIYVFKEE